MEGFLKRVDECNIPLEEGKETPLPFFVAGVQVGQIHQEHVKRLKQFPDAFTVKDGVDVKLNEKLDTFDLRTKAFDTVNRKLAEEGVITGWREEPYAVSAEFGTPPLATTERASAGLYGIMSYGVHINGYVEGADGTLRMWVARRSASKPTWPGCLDQVVAGGQPHGVQPGDNVLKECMEEANIPRELAQAALPTGVVAYQCQRPGGRTSREIIFTYDLKLPEGFVPENNDGEVDEFMLWPLDKVAESIASDGGEWKPNCCLVAIDFMIRHGFITPEQPGYMRLLHGLRAGVSAAIN